MGNESLMLISLWKPNHSNTHSIVKHFDCDYMMLVGVCVCVDTVWRCKQLSTDPIPSNVTTTNFHAPRAKISHASPSYNSNQAMAAAIAYRCAEGKGIGNKQDNVVWEPLTFDWFLIGSDRRLTWNEIHTGHPEHTTVENTNKQIGSERTSHSALGLHSKIKITTMADFFLLILMRWISFACMKIILSLWYV